MMGGTPIFLNSFPYLTLPARTGDPSVDTDSLLLANGHPKILAHIQQVAEVCAQLADRFYINREGCIIAALLHDANAIIRRDNMLRVVQQQGMSLCDAEKHLPFLQHQRLSSIIAKEHFGIRDDIVLSAIACHTTLRAHASPMDMVLFITDKLA